MLPSCEGENEGSRGRGKRSARRSYDKGKGKGKQVRSAPENDSEPDDSGADGSDEDDEGISKGHRKYTKQTQALRVSIGFVCIINTDQSDGRNRYELFSYRKVWW